MKLPAGRGASLARRGHKLPPILVVLPMGSATNVNIQVALPPLCAIMVGMMETANPSKGAIAGHGSFASALSL